MHAEHDTHVVAFLSLLSFTMWPIFIEICPNVLPPEANLVSPYFPRIIRNSMADARTYARGTTLVTLNQALRKMYDNTSRSSKNMKYVLR